MFHCCRVVDDDRGSGGSLIGQLNSDDDEWGPVGPWRSCEETVWLAGPLVIWSSVDYYGCNLLLMTSWLLLLSLSPVFSIGMSADPGIVARQVIQD